jgi:hypothetical protein
MRITPFVAKTFLAPASLACADRLPVFLTHILRSGCANQASLL